MKSYIHIIRHGKTEGNRNRWMYGATDLPLIADGFKEIVEYRKAGIYPEKEKCKFYTSGMTRCAQTLECIYDKVPFETIPALAEINCGEWECKSFKWLEENEPMFNAWAKEDREDSELFMPGGECRKDFIDRVHLGFEILKNNHFLEVIRLRNQGKEANSFAVLHGGVISAIMYEYFGDSVEKTFWTWITKPGRGYTLIFEDAVLTGYERI